MISSPLFPPVGDNVCTNPPFYIQRSCPLERATCTNGILGTCYLLPLKVQGGCDTINIQVFLQSYLFLWLIKQFKKCIQFNLDMLVSLIRSFTRKVCFSKHKSVKRRKKKLHKHILGQVVFLYIIAVMSTVEELLYGLRTTDGIVSDFFFWRAF